MARRIGADPAGALDRLRDGLLVRSDRLQDEINNMRQLVSGFPQGEGWQGITLSQARRFRRALEDLQVVAGGITDAAIVRGRSISPPLGRLAISIEELSERMKPVDVLGREGGGQVNIFNRANVRQLLSRSSRLVNNSRRVARVAANELTRLGR